MAKTTTRTGNNTLKAFMEKNFDFSTLKKVGFFKDIKFNDYEAQAKRLCDLLGYKTIFEYGKHQFSGHLTYSGSRTSVNEQGELKVKPFVETFFPNQMEI